MTQMSVTVDGDAESQQVWPQQQQQHVELQPGASKHQTAEFFLWTFKIEQCRADYPHNWSLCPYVHPNEKARRRDPRLFEYEPLPCPDDKKGTTCPRGEHCNYTHNIYEYWCHPKRFRTQVCQLGGACNRPICFFAHTAQELRRVDQPVHIPPTIARYPVTAPNSDRYQWTDSSAAAAAAAAAQQQAWQASAAAVMGHYSTYQQQLALQGLVAQQRLHQQQQLAMLQAASVSTVNAAQVQQQMWQQQQEQQQHQSGQAAAAAAHQYMAVQQALAQQRMMQQLPAAAAAAANARVAGAGRGAAASAGSMARDGSSHPRHMLPPGSLLQQQQQQAAVLAQMQALAVDATSGRNSNMSSALSSRRSSGGMPNIGALEPPAPSMVPAAAPTVAAPAVPGVAGGAAGQPAPLPVAAGAASGGVGSPLAHYSSNQLTSELSGSLAPLPVGAADLAAAQQQLLALEAAAALAEGMSSGCDVVGLPQQLAMASGNAQSALSDSTALLWAAQNACSGGYNDPLPLGLPDQDMAAAAALAGGGRGSLPLRYTYVQGPDSGSHLLPGPPGGAGGLSASSGSSNTMNALSLAGSAGSNILTRLGSAAAAAAAGGAGRGMLLPQQQAAADVELLQAALQQMGMGSSRHLQDL